MKLRDFIPPVFARVAQKSFAATAAAWTRGDDLTDRPATKLVSSYAQSGWVHAAVNLVSGEFTGLPLCFYAGTEEFDNPALDAWWAAPALGPDGKRLDRASVDRLIALWLQTEGEFFLLLDDAWLLSRFATSSASSKSSASSPFSSTPFIVARPDRVRLIVQAGTLRGYEYTDAAGRRSVYLPEQVVHRMEPNPLDEWRGLGRTQVARVATEGAFLTGVYIRDLMRNNGDQGFIVVGKGGVVDDAQREQIVAGLRAKRAALRSGIAKDLFLTGDITVERPTEQAAGADLTASQGMSQQEIFVTHGVPPSMATVKAVYSIGKDSDRYQLITSTSQPLSRLITGAYSELARRQTGLDLRAEHDWDDHPVMQEVRRARLDAGLKLWATGMAWRDINDYLGLGLSKFPGWEVAYLPFSVSPLSSGDVAPALDPVADPMLAEPEDDTLKTLRLLVLARSRTAAPRSVVGPPLAGGPLRCATAPDEFAAFTCGCSSSGERQRVASTDRDELVAQRADRPAAEIARWKTLIAQRRGTVSAFKSAFTRVLMQARVETLKKIEAVHVDPNKLSALSSQRSAPIRKNVAIDFLFDLAKFASGFRGAMENQQKAALKTAGDQLFAELGKTDPFASPPAAVTEFLAQRENKLRGVPQSVFDRVKATLQAGLDAGETTAQLSARVKSEFNGMADEDARRIAQTETSAAYGSGRDQAMRAAGIQFKAWLTSGNGNVRSSHEQAGLDYPPDRGIPLDEPFIVGGEELMHPGDTSGSAGNVINCHCVSIAVKAPEDAA